MSFKDDLLSWDANIKQLIVDFCGGKQEAFEDLMNLLSDGMIIFAYSRLRDYSDADIAIQQVWFDVYKKVCKDFQPNKFFAYWFLKILSNKCIDILRNRSGKSKLLSLKFNQDYQNKLNQGKFPQLSSEEQETFEKEAKEEPPLKNSEVIVKKPSKKWEFTLKSKNYLIEKQKYKKNEQLNIYEKTKAIPLQQLEGFSSKEQTPLQNLCSEETIKEIYDCIDQLNYEKRMIILSIIDGFNNEQIFEVLEDIENVSVKKFRARIQLCECLKRKEIRVSWCEKKLLGEKS